MDMMAAVVLIVALFAVLGAGMDWPGPAGRGSDRNGVVHQPAGGRQHDADHLGCQLCVDADRLAAVLWMGEILFRSKLSDSMFRGLAPWMDKLPGRLLHTNVVGCTILRRSPARRRPPAPRSAR